MGGSKLGFDALKETAAEYAVASVEARRDFARGDSEIEKLFYVALAVARLLAGYAVDSMRVLVTDESVEKEKNADCARFGIIVQPQAQLPGWRVDFLIHAYDWGMTGNREGWKRLVVECDGHAFHERTREQAARDRARDREAQYDGVQVFRFTGSELWRDPWRCAEQVLAWATSGT